MASLHGLSAAQKEKVKAMMHRARAGAAHLAKGTKGTLISGATGAGCYYGGKALTEKVEMFQKNVYAMPAAFLIAGHFLKRKQYDAGAAMIGVAGFTGANAYDATSSQQKTQPTQMAPGVPPGGGGAVPNAPMMAPAGAVMGAGYNMLDLPMLRGRNAGAVIDPEAGAVIQPGRRRMFALGMDDD